MGKYEELSKKVLENIGGVENITHVAHCATRLRINYAKKSLVDIEALKDVPGSAGIVNKQGQIQLIIGPSVNDAYNEFLTYSGWKENGGGASKKKRRTKARTISCIGRISSATS